MSNLKVLDENGVKRLWKKVDKRARSIENAHVKKTDGNTANGYAKLDANGLIPTSVLPSYVDDVTQFYDFETIAYAADIMDTAPAAGASYVIIFDQTRGLFFAKVAATGKYHTTWAKADDTVSQTSPSTGKIYYCEETEKIYRWALKSGTQAGGDMVDISVDNDIYRSELDPSETTSKAFGNIGAGTSLNNLNGKSISQILDEALFEEKYPATSDTSDLYTFTPGWPNNDNTVWAGSAAQITESAITGTTLTSKKGEYKIPNSSPEAFPNKITVPSPLVVKKYWKDPDDANYTEHTNDSTKFPAYLDMEGSYSYKVEADYGEGETLYTNRGNDAGKVSQGTASSTRSVRVALPLYTNGYASTNSPGNATGNTATYNSAVNSGNLDALNSISEKSPLEKGKWKEALDSYLYIKFQKNNASGDGVYTIYIPQGYAITKVQGYNSVAKEWQDGDSSLYETVELTGANAVKKYLVNGQWDDEPSEATGAHNFAVLFNRWQYKATAPTASAAVQLRFKIAKAS